ncbi:MAG: helix-hairpin-helix domain-containing protein [Balneola sp.]
MSDLVRAKINSSFGLGGKMYHPNSKGVLMPRRVAKAVNAEIIEEKEVEEVSTKVDAGKEPTSLPKETPEYDLLIEDDRFSTVEKLLENKDSLTEIKGIGEATAKKIIAFVTK